MRTAQALVAIGVSLVFGCAGPSTAAPRPEYGHVELITDTWGIPHAVSDTDEGAFYALGWATARDRGFQMTLSLRIMQGRLAELLGPKKKVTRNETAVQSDRMARTFGWQQAADRIAARLDRQTVALLQAYCEGVNDSFAAQARGGALHPLFERYACAPEPWKPSDCLLSWWHLAQFFATDGTRDLIARRNSDRPGMPRPDAQWFDDDAAVVQRSDVADDWLKRVGEFAAKHGFAAPPESTGTAPSMSHAWVVGGKRTTTGSAVLVSDPQTPVRHPSLFQEFHLIGKTINARGIGVPGSPVILIGFNERVAWGMTALGADQADLFMLETDPSSPDRYRWNGDWKRMTTRKETILVRGAAPVEVTVRETHLGPVVNEFAFRAPGEPDVALRRVPLCDERVETVQGAVAMMRAKSGAEFARALDDWRFPSANCVYGDAEGSIGYRCVGAIPIRPRSAPDRSGGQAIRAVGDTDAWQGFVPPELMPAVSDPASGMLFSANHRPIGSFYTIPIGAGTGWMGDTTRSWRLRELLAGPAKWQPEDVLRIHYDTVNPARREIVRLALHVRARQPDALSDGARRALEALEPWLKNGASSDTSAPGSDIATRISTFFRFMSTPLASRWGGGESGLARFLKEAASRISANPQTDLDTDEIAFLDQALSEAIGSAPQRRRADAVPPRQTLGWFDSLDGFGSLGADGDYIGPAPAVLDGQTIGCRSSQAYTQWVPLHSPDSALTVCPVGHSDRLDSPYRTSTADIWETGKLHPAPLSRAAIEKTARTREKLSR